MEKLIDFICFANQFRQIERTTYTKSIARKENDAEHCFQLALIAWYLIDSHKLPLDSGKAIRYALAHDLIEIYAGDTFAYSNSTDKHKREDSARVKIAETFNEFPELHTMISEYENHSNPESRFIYALDKFVAPLNSYIEGGKAWKEHGITLDMIKNNKTPKVALDPEVKKYFDELIKLLEEKEDELFPTQK